MSSHLHDEISHGFPVGGDLPDPVKYRVASVEFIIEPLQSESLGDLLRWQSTLVRDHDVAVLIEICTRDHDLLGSVCELLVAFTGIYYDTKD